MPYEVLSHTADTGVEATAPTCAELIDEIATGMFALMALVDPCPSTGEVEVEAAASTLEDLVVDILSELLYESETRDMILCGFVTELVGTTRARTRADGVRLSEVEATGPAVKAVTYHDLMVEERAGQWFGRVYFDV